MFDVSSNTRKGRRYFGYKNRTEFFVFCTWKQPTKHVFLSDTRLDAEGSGLPN